MTEEVQVFQIWQSKDRIEWKYIKESSQYFHAAREARDLSQKNGFHRVVRYDIDNLLLVTFKDGMAVPN